MADLTLAVLSDGEPRLVDPAAPLIRADDLAVLRGEGVFETARIFGGRAFVLEAHLARLRASAARMAVALPPADAWERLAAVALAGYGPADGSLRLVCTKGPAGAPADVQAFALAAPVGGGQVAGREQGVEAVTLTLGLPAGLRSDAPWLLGGVKSTSYGVTMAAQRQAVSLGVDDAIWLSSDGELLEATTAAVALVLDGEVVTPPPAEVGILASTTVAALAARGAGIVERRLSVADLRAADEVLLLSSVRGVAGVRVMDGVPVGAGTAHAGLVGPVGARLRDAYEEAVRAG